MAKLTCYALLSVNEVENTIVPVCNKFQYNGHPMGYVTSHIVMALAESGYQDLAMEGALYDVKLQSPNGQWGNGSTGVTSGKMPLHGGGFMR